MRKTKLVFTVQIALFLFIPFLFLNSASAQPCTDSDGDTYAIEGGGCGLIDCDDGDANVHPGAPEICDGKDSNCDGSKSFTDVDGDGDGVFWCAGDCDDKNPNRFPGNAELCDGIDNDCSGLPGRDERDTDGDGVMICDAVPDCNDFDDTISPANAEICGDSKDNNCNNYIDEAECICPDEDGDGHQLDICGGDDCNDMNPSVYLGAPEQCTDGIDNDCDGKIDVADSDAINCPFCTDSDRDGYSTEGGSCGPVDCNDSDPNVNPAVNEVCDGIDTNCDGTIPYTEVDADKDGVLWCAGDCADNDPNRFPGNPEVCDGLDNDCNGVIPSVERDIDKDGFKLCDAYLPDCNDAFASDHPGADEICGDGRDNNCNGEKDESGCVCPDQDGDGQASSVCGGPDCDDSEPAIYLGAPEICTDGWDNDCDGMIDLADSDAVGCPECVDADGDGFATNGGVCGPIDCNDSNPNVKPGVAEICDGMDTNCDGFQSPTDVDSDGDGVAWCAGDCDESNPAVYPGATELCDGLDNDCNGIKRPDEHDSDNDGYRLCDVVPDCNDFNASVNPGAAEVCDDKIDNNCDQLIDGADNSCAPTCVDKDNDGYGEIRDPSCPIPNIIDCDDNNALVNRSAPEICNAIDDNCDDRIDEGFDTDGDGYTTCAGDCDDSNSSIKPSAPEICNAIDDNCDGTVDEGFDSDADGVTTCAGDCDDTNAAVNPSAVETCNAIDDNCDGIVDEGFDSDADGITLCAGDCDDTNPGVNPSATETCNGIDDDCDASIDEGFDADADGVTSCNGDCDDSNSSVSPNAAEICNGIDDNCDGFVDEGFDTDADADGFSTCSGDCDDTDASVNPDAIDICNGIDDNCNGSIDEESDRDGDGYKTCEGDCNDNNAAVNPGEVEICNNGVDENCDGIDDRCLPADIVVIEKARWKDDDGGRLEVNSTSSQNGVPVLAVLYDGSSYQMTFDVADNRYERSITGVPYYSAVEVSSSLGGFDIRDVSGDGTECEDIDNDGYGIGAACLGPDCDDNDPSISPAASDICDNGIDENCNGEDDTCIASDIVYITEAEWEDDDGGKIEIKALSSHDNLAKLTVQYDGNSYVMYYDNFDKRHELAIYGVPYFTTIKVTSSLGSSASSGVDREGICGSGNMITIKKSEWANEDGGALKVTVKRYYDDSISLTVLYGGTSYPMTYKGNNEYKLKIKPIPFYSSIQVTSSTGNFATANVELDD